MPRMPGLAADRAAGAVRRRTDADAGAGGLTMSLEGGLEEFEEFFSSEAIFVFSAAFSAFNRAFSARNAAFSASSSVSRRNTTANWASNAAIRRRSAWGRPGSTGHAFLAPPTLLPPRDTHSQSTRVTLPIGTPPSATPLICPENRQINNSFFPANQKTCITP